MYCFAHSTKLSCVSRSIDICPIATKTIRNMHVVTANQITDILHFNDNT